jgi:hypothetical protein
MDAMRRSSARAGAPAANRTFFCDYGGQYCYSHTFKKAGFQAAADDCTAQGGSLVQYGSAAQQLLVEQVGGQPASVEQGPGCCRRCACTAWRCSRCCRAALAGLLQG